MNAQSPIAAGDLLTQAAVQAPDVLDAIAQAPADAPLRTPGEVAKATGRETKNMARLMDALKRGQLVDDADGYRLTEAGIRVRLALQVAAGAGVPQATDPENDVLLIAHHHMRPNRAQPRQRDWDSLEEREKTEQLAATIYETGEVLHNLVVFPADDQGDHDIADGERRWRAVGLLIEQGLWPTDRRLKAVQRQRGAGDVAFLALVANGARDGLTMFEQAKAYRDLIAEKGWSAREAALKTGRDVRTVQEMAKVWRDATPENLEAFEAGTMTWEAIRDSVKESKATATPESEQADLEDLVPADHRARLNLADVAEQADPLVVNGHRFPNITLANQARFALEGGAPSNSGGGSKRAPAFDAASLKPHQRLALIEIDHKHTAEGEGDWVKVRDYWLDQSFADISGLKLVGVTHATAGGPHAGLTQAGRDALVALGFTPGGITEADLDAARIACGQPAWPAWPASKGYVSPWLNVPPGDAAAPALQAAAAAEPDGAAERMDADEEADEELLDDLIGRLREGFAKTLGGDERWNRLSVTGLASAACIAVQEGHIRPAIEALAALLKRESDYRGGAILRGVVFGSGLDHTPERDTSDDDPLLFALRSGDVVSVGGAASGYRLLSVEDRQTGAYPVEGLAFRAQQVSLKTGRDVGQPRQVTLHAIQGMVAQAALKPAKTEADA